MPSVLFSFGKDTALKKRSKGKTKIKVQPTSQKRRVSKKGSHQKQSSGRKVKLSVAVGKACRVHKLSDNVRNNERIPNKAKLIMKSKSLHKKRVSETDDQGNTSKLIKMQKK